SDTEQGGAGTLLWEQTLDAGEKVWSAPTIAAGRIYVATATGTMESDDPATDVAGAGYLYSLDLKTGAKTWQDENSTDVNIQQGRLGVGKTRGSIYVDSQHVYLTTIEGDVIQVGDGNFIAGNANNAILKAWRQF
ncbi:MAG: PQQ-like beta-propeller repeat protein, partial [Deltaproteobacteria bacterium]|nr:PQQ-like beta-propeller repeat protein [Deltaproteobacteria bacterium]